MRAPIPWIRRATMVATATLALGLAASSASAQVPYYYVVPPPGNNYYGANDVLVPIGGVNPGYFQGVGSGLGQATGGYYGAYNTRPVANPGTYSTAGVGFNAQGMPLNSGVPNYGALGYGGSGYGGFGYYGYSPYYPRPYYTPPYATVPPQPRPVVAPSQVIQFRPGSRVVVPRRTSTDALTPAPTRPVQSAPLLSPERAASPVLHPNVVVTPPGPPVQAQPSPTGPRVIQPRSSPGASNANFPSRVIVPGQRKEAAKKP